MSLLGQDSWSPPTQALLDNLAHLQNVWFGGYVGGRGLYLNTPWPKSGWTLLKENHYAPLPIYVPRQSLNGENPQSCARDAINLTVQMGMTGVVAVDCEIQMASVLNFEAWVDEWCATVAGEGWKPVTYAGSHYVGRGSWAWHVEWGNPWLEPPSGTAYQYGPHGNPNSFETDANNASDDFPFATWIGDTMPAMPTPDPHSLVAPICAIVIRPQNDGYWLVARDGGIFAYGNAAAYKPNVVTPDTEQEIVDAAGTATGDGLYLVGADGGVFAYGDATFHGSIPQSLHPSNLPPEG